MKNLISVFTIILVSFTLISGCKKDKKNDNSLALLLLAANSRGLSPAVAKQVGTVRNAISSAISSATTAAKNNNITFKMELPKSKMERNKDRLLAAMHKGAISAILNKNKGIAPTALPTATGGMTCNADFSSCTGTVNGTATCSSGGTVRLQNVVTSYKFVSTPSEGSSGTAKGTIILNKCKSNNANYYDYPNYIISEGTGTITIDSNSAFTYNSYSGSTPTFATSGGISTFSIASSKSNLTVKETSTSTSTDFKDGSGETVAFSNLKNVLSVVVDSTGTNVSFAFNADYSTITFKGDYVDILDGTLTSSGTVGGSAINTTFTYEKTKTYTYNVNCSLTATTSATCTVTNK